MMHMSERWNDAFWEMQTKLLPPRDNMILGLLSIIFLHKMLTSSVLATSMVSNHGCGLI